MPEENSNTVARRTRNWPITIGRIALVWAFVEAVIAGVANMTGSRPLGVGEEHFALDAVVAALVGIGFVIDGASRRLQAAAESAPAPTRTRAAEQAVGLRPARAT